MTSEHAPTRPVPPRRALPVLITLIIALIVMSNLGDIFWARLADTHPAWLLVLSSRNRYLALTTNQLDAFTYYGIGASRLLVADPLFYLLGLFYGDRVLAWLERKSHTYGRHARQYETVFGYASYPLIVLAPNNVVCLLAGAARIRPAVFAALNVVGTIGRLAIIRIVGDVFRGPLDSVLDWIAQYRWYLMIASFLVVGATILSDRRKGGGEIAALRSLEEELEHETDDPPEDAPPGSS